MLFKKRLNFGPTILLAILLAPLLLLFYLFQTFSEQLFL